MFKWKIASAYVIGQGHVKNNTSCQDRTFKLVKKSNKDTFYGLALADGAGSCKYSDIGAEFITKKILYFLNSKFNYIFKYKNPNIYIIKYVEKELKKIALNKNINFKDLSSTLLFVTIKGDKVIIGHIGDGVIGALNNKEEINVISLPENGEYSNSTFFTTSVNYKKRLRIIKGTIKSTDGFILMSDGTEESLYDKRIKKLIDTNKYIINWLKDNSEKKVEKALEQNLKNIFSKRTYDDCSIGIIRRV